MRKLRLRELTWLASGPTTPRWWSKSWTSDSWSLMQGPPVRATTPVLSFTLFPSLWLHQAHSSTTWAAAHFLIPLLALLSSSPQTRLSPRSVLIFLSLANPTSQKSSDSQPYWLHFPGIYFQLLDGRFHLDILLDPKSQYFPNHIDHLSVHNWIIFLLIISW